VFKLSLESQERTPFFCAAVASACATSGALAARAAGDTLFLDFYGTHFLALMYVGTSVLVGALAFLFGRSVRRASLGKVLIFSSGFLCLLALLLRVALIFPWPGIRIAAYFWGDLTVNGSMLLFWSMFGQLFNFGQVKRFLGWIGAGGTVACITAGLLIRPFARVFGTQNLLVVVAILMAVFAVTVSYLVLRSGKRLGGVPQPEASLPGMSYYAGMFKTPRVRFFALQAMVATMVVVMVDYQFKAVAQAHFSGPHLAAFFGDFYAVTNIAVLLIQLFALQFLLKGKRLLSSLCVLPAGLLLGGAATIATASFIAVLATKLIAQTTLFTIDGGAFQILYLGVKKQTRTQVRALVDGICKPAAIGITGAFLLLISRFVQVYYLAVPGVALCVIWLFVARRNYSLYLSGLIEGLHARLFDPSEDPHGLHDQTIVERTRNALGTAKLEELPYLLNVAQQLDDVDWSAEIRNLLLRPEPEIKIAALEYLCQGKKSANLDRLVELARDPAAEVRRVAVRAAGLGGEAVMDPVRESLEDPDPGVRAEAATALIDMGHFGGLLQGVTAVKGMLESDDKSYRMAVASPVSRLKVRGRTESLLQLLNDSETDVRLAALRACANTPEAELVPKVIAQLGETRTAGAAADALIALGSLTADYLCAQESPAELLNLFRRSVHLPAILEKIGSPRALEALKRVLDFAGPKAPAGVVLAYRRILQRQVSLDSHAGHWESVLRCQMRAVQEREQILAGTASLAGNSFLEGVLREEYASHLKNVLGLLGLQIPTVKMEAIYLHLQDKDEDVRAHARELLEHVLPVAWRSEILELVDKRGKAGKPSDPVELLRHLMQSQASDPALLGAIYAAAISGSSATIPLIQDLLSHPNEIVRETALFAVIKVAPAEEAMRQCRKLLADPKEAVRELAQSALRESGKIQQEGATPMIVVEKILFLRHVPLLTIMESSELEHVASIAKEVTFPAGTRIIKEGEHGDCMFLIVDGEVVIQRGESPLKTLGARDFFGEMSIIDGEPRSASAIAHTDCLLLRIDKDDFNELLITYNSAAVSVIRALTKRLRDALPALERAQRGM
jgi:HEAT repeat protein